MRFKNSILQIIPTLLFLVGAFFFYGGFAQDEPAGGKYLLVEFYSVEKSGNQPQFLGTAEYKDNQVTINVTDEKLRQSLESPYVLDDSNEALQQGTYEHLLSVAESITKDYVVTIYYGSIESQNQAPVQ